MGHLINPVGFRLVYFNTWLDVWSCEKNFLYSEMLHSIFDCKKVLNFFLEGNLLEKYGLIFSHYSIESSFIVGGFNAKCFFYDSIAEDKLKKFLIIIETFNKEVSISYKFLLKKFKKDCVCVSNKIKVLKKINYFEYILVRKIILFITYLLLEEGNFLEEEKKYIRDFFYKNVNKEFFKKICRFSNIHMYLIDLIKMYFIDLRKGFLKKFHQYDKRNENLYSFFNFSIFINIFHITYLVWWRYQQYFKYMCIVDYKKGSVFNSFYYKDYLSYSNYSDRYLIFFFSLLYRLYIVLFRQINFFNFLKLFLLPYINKISIVPIKLEFFGISNDTVSSNFLAKFLIKKLEQKFKLIDLFGPIADDLRLFVENGYLIEGYKMQFIGRLSRRDRVRTVWIAGGKLPLTSVTKNVDHSYMLGVLKNGVCCIRVWLLKSSGTSNMNNSYKYIINVS